MKRLLLILCLPPFMYGMEVPSHAVSTKEQIKLLHDKTHFYVSNENASYRIPSHEVSPLLKQVLKRNALAEYSRSCKIRVKKHKDGTYALVDKVIGLGGGPVLGGFLYGTVKVLAYTGMAVMGTGAVVTVTAATGGTATPLLAGAGVLAKGAVAATTTQAVIGTALAGTSVGTAAGAGTTALVATAGTAGALGFIESAALWAWGIGMAAPTI